MKDKIAIVTGGAGGIGSAICRAFAAQGLGVAVADNDREAASKLPRMAARRWMCRSMSGTKIRSTPRSSAS